MNPTRAPAALPQHFALVRQDETLELSWRWVLAHRRMAASGVVLAAAAWGGVVLLPLRWGRPVYAFDWIFYMAVILVALILTVFALFYLLNRTTIRIHSQRPRPGGAFRDGPSIRVLTIEHRPFSFDEVTLRAEQIERLFCKEVKHRGGDSSSYELHAAVAGGRSVKLLDLDSPEQALFVEQELEAALRIRDVPKQGELPRSTV